MNTHGPAFYDDDAVFAMYTAHRQQPDNPPDTLEKPIFLDLVGAVAGLRILDLGCGTARFGRDVLARDCQRYVGVEGSQNMVTMAEQILAGSPGQIVHSIIETWDYPEAAFDLVVSRLVLHYIEDFAALCANVYHTLGTNGRFIFSVEHPVVTADARNWETNDDRHNWIVDNYFVPGPRSTPWLGGRVVRYHRTIDEYFGTIQNAGFVIESLRESRPRREQFADGLIYEQHKRIPLFLLLAARKS
jgi:SAM-dependent methyltransferase